jgi:hypothetical protein
MHFPLTLHYTSKSFIRFVPVFIQLWTLCPGLDVIKLFTAIIYKGS